MVKGAIGGDFHEIEERGSPFPTQVKQRHIEVAAFLGKALTRPLLLIGGVRIQIWAVVRAGQVDDTMLPATLAANLAIEGRTAALTFALVAIRAFAHRAGAFFGGSKP